MSLFGADNPVMDVRTIVPVRIIRRYDFIVIAKTS
jgi:hypothetical protein